MILSLSYQLIFLGCHGYDKEFNTLRKGGVTQQLLATGKLRPTPVSFHSVFQVGTYLFRRSVDSGVDNFGKQRVQDPESDESVCMESN